MFFETGDLRIAKAKSVLKQQLQVVSPNEDHSDKFTCCVLDGSAMLYVIKWTANRTVNDFLNNFKAFIARKMKMYDVFLVFDRYNEYSTKSVTRSGRQSKVSKTHKLTNDMIIPAQSVVLGVTENKKQLIRTICKDLCEDQTFHKTVTQKHKLVVTGQCDVPIEIHQVVVINREDLKTSHEEADVITIQQMNNAVKEGHTGVVVTSDDTDVFVLLVYHYVMLNLSIELIMESHVKDRSQTDIKQTSHEHADIAKRLLAAHALSGCDTVAAYHGIGKSKVIKTLKSGMPLQLLGDTIQQQKCQTYFKSQPNLCPRAMVFLIQVTSQALEEWFGHLRWPGRPQLCRYWLHFPPTKSFIENVKRAHLQACTWKHALNEQPPDLDPCDYGWERDETTKSLLPVTVAKGVELAPPDILRLVKCNSVSNKPCASQRCTCNQARFPCTLFCSCQRNEREQCCNKQTQN